MQDEEVHHGRIGGLRFTRAGRTSDVEFVVWNQWRSGAKSLFSKYLAELLLKDERVGSVLFLDRIATGGMSDNSLSKSEKKMMKKTADLQFADEYAEAVGKLTNGERVIVVGSSGGTQAVMAALQGLNNKKLPFTVQGIMVEPTGLRQHGIKGEQYTALAHGMTKHVLAYRHRLKRGWWRPMDREQYFAKSTPLEYRAMYFSTGQALKDLLDFLVTNHIQLDIYFSTTSHMHSKKERDEVEQAVTSYEHVHHIQGVHDKVCQPENLQKIYLGLL